MKLNLGCGPHVMPGWVNIDLGNHKGLEFESWDLREGLPSPIKENSVDFIYMEHFIEHITMKEAETLLSQCRKVMEPWGVIRISTPDLYTLVDNYLAWSSYGKEAVDDDIPEVWKPATACLMMNEGMRSWGHQFIYDLEELTHLLERCGFDTVKTVPWRGSEHPELRELEVRPYHRDLIVEASR